MFDIQIVSCEFEGILGISLTHKVNNLQFIVISCYLPPEDSPCGRHADVFFNNILSLVYKFEDVDNMFICGDVNARVGDLCDHVQYVDNLPTRVVIDQTRNTHGQAFVDFLHEGRMCIVNGRINGSDNFTNIGVKGKSVVDYIVTDHSSLDCCSNWEVIPPLELMSRSKTQNLVTSRCKPPDHSFLRMCFNTTVLISDSPITCNIGRSTESVDHSQSDMYSKFSQNKKILYDEIPQTFMASIEWQNELQSLLTQIDQQLLILADQNDVDLLYDDFCKALFNEISRVIRIKDTSKQVRKKFKYYKPYWNNELTNLWKRMREAEKKFTNYRQYNPMQKQQLRSDFTTAQH